MKQTILLFTITLFLVACGTETPTEKANEKNDSKTELKVAQEESVFGIGDTNPALETKLKDISGEELFIENLGQKNGALLIFSCNTCPFVVGNGDKSQGWENRYNDIQSQANELEIGFALINSNEAKRDGVDSFEKMIEHAKENAYNNIRYLMDENHVVADKLNAMTTPHVFLFDNQNKLVYTGAIDDNVDYKEEVKEHWLADAMKELSEGKEITKPITKNMGCSIKRVKKEDAHHGHNH